MPKFSQIPTNGSPALTDFQIGVTSGGVDYKATLAVLAALFSSNLTVNSVSKRQLNYVESTDIGNGTAIANNTWVDLKGNMNFTVDDANSVVLIMPRCGMIAGGQAAGGMDLMSRIIIDSAGTARNRYMGASRVVVAGQYNNPWGGAGPVAEIGLAAGVHTIKFQIRVSYSSTGANYYCRAGTVPEQEWLGCDIIEFKR